MGENSAIEKQLQANLFHWNHHFAIMRWFRCDVSYSVIIVIVYQMVCDLKLYIYILNSSKWRTRSSHARTHARTTTETIVCVHVCMFMYVRYGSAWRTSTRNVHKSHPKKWLMHATASCITAAAVAACIQSMPQTHIYNIRRCRIVLSLFASNTLTNLHIRVRTHITISRVPNSKRHELAGLVVVIKWSARVFDFKLITCLLLNYQQSHSNFPAAYSHAVQGPVFSRFFFFFSNSFTNKNNNNNSTHWRHL